MKPLKLAMTAFGPYRNEEIIDFTKLGEHRLFVIAGNTGAGKTTIFDAICFALFGYASGEDRMDPRMLRSQFADEDTHTAVEMTFASGGRTYRVLRQMKHRKGANKSETGEKTELYELRDDEEIPAVDRFITTEVNARLLAIVGLTKEQFSQIVMLPQGEFRKLLTSDTDNKEDILRRIFRTELFQRLQGKFQQRNRELQDRLKEQRAGAAAVMRQAAEALPLREESLLQATFGQESYNSIQVGEALALEAEHYRLLQEKAELDKQEAGAALEKLQQKLQDMTLLNGRHDELDLKRRQLHEHSGQSDRMSLQEQALKLAVTAERLRPHEEAALRSGKTRREQELMLEQRVKELEEAEVRRSLAAARLQEEAAKEEQRHGAERELNASMELLPIVQSLSAREKAIAGLDRRCKEALAAARSTETSLLEGRARRNELLQQITASEKAMKELNSALQELASIEASGKAVKRLLGVSEELRQCISMESQYKQALASARRAHEALEQAWIEGQAGLLASHLHDGQACPVCGSLEHPGKASNHEEMPSKEQVQEAKERLAHVERELMAVQAQAAAATSAQALDDEEWDQLLPGLGKLPLAEDATEEKLQKRQAELREAWKIQKETAGGLQLAADALDGLRLQQGELESRLAMLEAELEASRGRGRELELQHAAEKALLERELERIPEPLRSPEALNEVIASGQRRLKELQKAWQNAQEEAAAAEARLAECRAYANGAHERYDEALRVEEESGERLKRELAQAGFGTVQDYRNALLEEGQRERMRSELEQYRTSVAALNASIAQLEEWLAGTSRFPTEELQAGIAVQKEAHEGAIRAEGEARRFNHEASRLKEAVGATAASVARLEKELEDVLDLYSMLKGENSLKLSFERYILIEYLEQIVSMANVRLAELSNGQFQLQRSDRLESRGKQSGLGLDVYDAYTGQQRDVKTLSGGEKFNASLCLALGMTDVIQSVQGGISIEMMLIDEGFGSLDEESLQKAVAALVDLQKRGRMIGVISHVGELKEAFPACLEVHKTKEGYSKTRLVLK
ncbi:AAA family ATPase [Paenibacillus sp. CAU 1782]